MHIGIAGAGMMGKLLAYALLNEGYTVTLFDQGTLSGGRYQCSMAAAGLLSPAAELEKNDFLIYQMGMASITHYWPKLVERFPCYFARRGSLVIAHPLDEVELTRYVSLIQHKTQNQQQLKIGEWLSQHTLTDLEPELTRFKKAYYFNSEAQLDNQTFLTSLNEYLCDFIQQQKILTVIPYQIHTEKKINYFDLVIDCRGLGASSNFKELRAIRGELIWLAAKHIKLSRPLRVMHPRYSLYIVPRPNQQYLIGASEIESDDDSAISVQTILELLTAAYSVHPGFSEARLVKTVTACRPVLPHHLPEIRYADGFLAVNGLYRHGFLLGPALMTEILTSLKHGKTSLAYPQLWKSALC